MESTLSFFGVVHKQERGGIGALDRTMLGCGRQGYEEGMRVHVSCTRALYTR